MKTIGILGGLGPEATADLFKKIISVTPAKSDQEHINTIIISNPHIPDSTNAILYGGESPVPQLLSTARVLEALNSSIIIMPCNTAHYFLEEIQSKIKVPFLNMIKEAALYVKQYYPDVKKVGLLATTGTIKSKIYEKEFKKHGLKVVAPDDSIQNSFVMSAIYGSDGIKAGYKVKPRKMLKYASLHLQEKGAEIIIQGCTEVPLVLTKKHCDQIQIDVTKIAAMKAVEKILDERILLDPTLQPITVLAEKFL